MSIKEAAILSHGSDTPLADRIAQIKERLIAEGDKSYVTVAQQLELLEQFQQFELGRFIILNAGVDGYWTHYIMSYPEKGARTGLSSDDQPICSFEKRMLETFPVLLATQQRYQIFQNELQKNIRENTTFASLPCGLMTDLLTLNYKDVKNFNLVGIDLDPNSLWKALLFAQQLGLEAKAKFLLRDAWKLDTEQEFDVLTSNGLNIYEPSDEKIVALYQQFYKTLKKGGTLITSFLTPPPIVTKDSEWLMEKINKEDLLLQKIVLGDIVQAKWQCFRSSELTQQQLEAAGFSAIEFIYDTAHIFPTVVARRI